MADTTRATSLSRLLKRLAADLYLVVKEMVVVVLTEDANQIQDDEHDAAKIGKAFLPHPAVPKLWHQRSANSNGHRCEGDPLVLNGEV